MGIAFNDPLVLILLPVLLALTLLLHVGSRRRIGTFRRRASLVVRALLLAALTFALAGFQVVLPVDRLATVFVVDLSDSVGQTGRTEALSYVRDSLVAMPHDDMAGVVAFGKDALVERLPAEVRELDAISSVPVQGATDIGGALRLAAALFPDDAQKRIVLLSDGNDTTGAGQAEAALAAAQGIQVQTHVIGLGGSAEVLVERVTSPSTAHLGEDIEVSATITSTVAQLAAVRLFADGGLVATQQLNLSVGQTSVRFQVKAKDAGFHIFRVAVEAGQDTFSQNNRADSDTIVKGEPRILVVAGDPAIGSQLVDALRIEHQQVDTALPEALPGDLAGLANYDSVVLVDVPRSRLTTTQMAALQTYVRDIGRGLVMVGGPDSYGAGGYTKTPLEESLPVDMGVRDRQKEPDIALVVVIDQSGSMAACHCNTFDRGSGSQIAGVKKVDIGKEAILRAVSAMSARDQLGVVGFNESAHWAIHTAPLGTEGDIASQIAGIQPDGQTNIFAGLDEAVKSLEGVTAARRHIILFTDGWSTNGAYGQIIARMKADGITLSTIGAGGGSAPVLAQLAKDGGGRYYPAPNPASIPDIFLKETQQVSGQQIVEEPFHPIQTSDSPILRGITTGFPTLLGYNGTTAKSAAQTVLVTARDDPLLAQWQYGLGRSVAWTSDTTGHWAKDWIGWPGFSRFFSQLVSWTFPGEETGGIEARFDTQGGKTTLHVESVAADGSPRDFYSTTATIVAPDLTPLQVTLPQVAPGVYETTLGELGPGAYAIRLNQTKPGSSALGRTVGLVAPTAAEYRSLGPNEPLLAAIRTATGGTVADDPVAVWKHDLATTSTFTDLWPALLVLAMLLWPIDVALRRVSVGRRELVSARAWVRGLPARRRRAAPRTADVEVLIDARKRTTGTAARAAMRDASVAERETSGSPATGIAPTERAAPLAPPAASPVPPVRAPDTPRGAALDPDTSRPPTADETMTRLREAKRRTRDR
ncbi:MAG TPA: VWA domain-containing protein [Candidatus Limnocylindrales bacterium]